MGHALPRICPGKGDVENSLEFWDTNGLSNPGQTTRSKYSQQKREPAD